MELNRIFKNLIWTIIVVCIAFLTLIYPILEHENTKSDFSIVPKKFKITSDLERRDINQSIIRSKLALTHNKYDVGMPFNPVSFRDAWRSSSPNFLSYLTKNDTVYSNTSHEFLVQTLGILYDFIIAHEQTKDNRFLFKGYELINDWYKHNSGFSPFQSSLVWNDHVTAERIQAILSFHDYASQFLKLSNKNIELINKVTKDSVLFLASSYNYKPKHNHGIYEDFALLVSASYLKNKELQAKYYNIAISRFETQVFETFDSGGVHLENSPKYHLIVTDLLNDFVAYSKTLSLNIDKKTLDRIKLANKNKYFFVLNNGNIPPVGDSMYIPYKSFLKLNDEVLISQKGGYVIYKDDNHYLLLRTQSISSAHAHQDQLSFVYENDKHLIASDSGFLDYSSSKESIFLHSPQAHNTIYFQNNKTKRDYFFTNILNTKSYFYCRISSIDKRISREFLLNKNLNILLVHDNLETDEKHNIFEILNLGLDVVDVTNKKKYAEVFFADGEKYYITSYQDGDSIDSVVLHGSRDPYFGAWRAITYKKLIPSYALWTQLDKKKDTKFTRVISKDITKLFDILDNNTTLLYKKNQNKYDFNLLRTKSKEIAFEKTQNQNFEENKLIKKIKKKLQPLFFKRIKIFFYETSLMLIMLIIAILFKRKYISWLFYLSGLGIVILDIFILISI